MIGGQRLLLFDLDLDRDLDLDGQVLNRPYIFRQQFAPPAQSLCQRKSLGPGSSGGAPDAWSAQTSIPITAPSLLYIE